jgi:aminoglycoside phosphotransferase (APT) family kinase protein
MDTPLEVVVGARHFSQIASEAVGAADLAQQRGNAPELAQICQAWGAAIATLHTTSTHQTSAPLAARPWVVNPRHLSVSMSGAACRSGYAAVVEAYEASGDLRAAVREVDERWTEHHWIHGDLTATNVRVELRPAVRVSFLNLEDAGLGDPAWDLATAVRALATAIWVARAPHGSTGQEPGQAELATWVDRAQAHAGRVGCLMAVA